MKYIHRILLALLAINLSAYGQQIPFDLRLAEDRIRVTYGDSVTVQGKEKALVKFGTHTSQGTGWETLAEMQDAETEETFVTGNDITTIVSTDATDNETITIEGQTYSAGVTTFVTQTAVLDGQTPVTLDTPLFRVTRLYNSSTTTIAGNIAVYEGGAITAGKPDVDSTVHGYIVAGEQQSQKASTTISGSDYYIIEQFTLSNIDKANSWAEARVEYKNVDSAVWLPLSQDVSASDESGTTVLPFKAPIIVPKNSDVRISVRCNTSGVTVSGGIQGYLAKVINP